MDDECVFWMRCLATVFGELSWLDPLEIKKKIEWRSEMIIVCKWFNNGAYAFNTVVPKLEVNMK